MENVVFYCLVGERKWRRQKTRQKVWREKCCESTFTQIPCFSLFSQLQTQQTFSQTSLKLKYNKIIIIQTKKQNFKINQIITIKAKKKKKRRRRRQKTEDRSHLTHLDCVGNKDERQHSDPSLLLFLSIPLFFLFLS